MRLFKKQRYSELENWLLTHFEWDFVSEKDLKIISSQFKPHELYNFKLASDILNTDAISLFKKVCSQISVPYYEVERIFLKQNCSFFDTTKTFNNKSEVEKGQFFISVFNTLIVPKPTNVEKLLNKIQRLSPEEQAEALLLIANKKIKIVVEDI